MVIETVLYYERLLCFLTKNISYSACDCSQFHILYMCLFYRQWSVYLVNILNELFDEWLKGVYFVSGLDVVEVKAGSKSYWMFRWLVYIRVSNNKTLCLIILLKIRSRIYFFSIRQLLSIWSIMSGSIFVIIGYDTKTTYCLRKFCRADRSKLINHNICWCWRKKLLVGWPLHSIFRQLTTKITHGGEI